MTKAQKYPVTMCPLDRVLQRLDANVNVEVHLESAIGLHVDSMLAALGKRIGRVKGWRMSGGVVGERG